MDWPCFLAGVFTGFVVTGVYVYRMIAVRNVRIFKLDRDLRNTRMNLISMRREFEEANEPQRTMWSRK